MKNLSFMLYRDPDFKQLARIRNSVMAQETLRANALHVWHIHGENRVAKWLAQGAFRGWKNDDLVMALSLDTIRCVHRGESRLSPAIARKVLAQFRTFAEGASVPHDGHSESTPARPVSATGPEAGPVHGRATARPAADEEALTEKEARILDLLGQGMSNKQIAAAVFLAEGTIKNYVSRIMEKLHATSRLELALRAVARKG